MAPISVQLYSVRDLAKVDFFGVLKRIADMGYVGVEPAGLHGKGPKEVRQVLDDLGLRASSAHVGLPKPETLSETVDTAKALGYDLVISGFGPNSFQNLDGIKAAAEAFQKAAGLLKPHGLRMGYHNHWWEMGPIDGRYGLEVFLELAPDVFSQLDTYWARNFGAVDVAALVRKLKSRIPSLHIKDGPLVRDQPHTAAGQGKMDFPPIVKAADKKVLRWLVVELDSCGTDMVQAVADSYSYLTGQRLARGRK